MITSIEIEAFNLSDIMQWAMTEMRQFMLINSHRRGNVYFLKVKRMLSAIVPPPLHEEEECQVANVDENAPLMRPKSILMDQCSEIKFEGQF